ncbi:MAG TPA: MlaD family protein [Candidatus Dormibacteraeota bacterium]|jgi:virulence factor Mce-like protein|nr:MlaD family protein [Candidatus Dormibacteraeota bacterium]
MPSNSIGRNLAIIAAFAVFSLSGLLWMAIQTGQRFGPLPPEYRVAFSVRDADALVDGSDVRISGIPVGRVISVTQTGSGAQVVMGIDLRYRPIYTDATALIRPKSLLGEKYVDLTRGRSNQEVPDGGSLPPAQAYTQVELDQVLQNMDAETRKAMSVDLISLGGGVAGRGTDINATIPELRTIAEHLTPVAARFKDRTAQIDHILVDTDTILTTLAQEHDQLAGLLQSADAVTGTVAQNDAHLANVLNNGSDLFSRLNTVVGQQNNDANLRAAVEAAPGDLTHLNQLLTATNPIVDTAIPSLLLGLQYSYPSDQLTVSQKNNLPLNTYWQSSFAPYDPSNGLHAYGFINLNCSDTGAKYQCPGTYLTQSSGVPAAAAANAGGPQSLAPTDADARAFLAYLLGA